MVPLPRPPVIVQEDGHVRLGEDLLEANGAIDSAHAQVIVLVLNARTVKVGRDDDAERLRNLARR